RSVFCGPLLRLSSPFLFHDTLPTDIYPLSLHDALPICVALPPPGCASSPAAPRAARARPHPPGLPDVGGDAGAAPRRQTRLRHADRKSTRLNSSHEWISYAVFCLKKKKSERRVFTIDIR